MICHNYIFFTIRPEFHQLSKAIREASKKAFLQVLKREKNVISTTYSTLGLKANTSILIWFQEDAIEHIQDFLNELMHTDLGTYLQITYTLFGMTRQTQYSHASATPLDTTRKGGKYLIIYPFTKTYSWYELPLEDRKELMKGHISIGKKYPQITQLLLYSYGVDDSEFIVSYEVDNLSEFQSLVMELRSDKVRAYTLKDTPIFTCIYKEPEEVIAYL
jgi:chlorite dismutase